MSFFVNFPMTIFFFQDLIGVRLSKTLLPVVQQHKNECVSVISDDDEIIPVYPTIDQQQLSPKTNDNTTPKKVIYYFFPKCKSNIINDHFNHLYV